VPITKIACPECGTALTSASGFAAGRTTTCAKCEAEFVVPDPALVGGPDEPDAPAPAKEWSYRTSTLRYVVLTALVAVMGVLGYMLYEKKAKEREEARSGGPDDDVEVINPDRVKARFPAGADGDPQFGPAAVGGAGGRPPARTGLSTDDIGKRLAGRWEWSEGGVTVTAEYGEGGAFSYTATGAEGGAISGGWFVGTIPTPTDPTAPLLLPLRFSARGGPNGVINLPPALVKLTGNKLEGHPLLHLDGAAVKTGTFVKK
jgi:hypothetical protein